MKGRGFTLIEVMVSVAILAIIASMGIVAFSQFQVIGRDTKRKSDLRAMAQALKLYSEVNKGYPCTGDTGSKQFSTEGDYWITDAFQGGCGSSVEPFDATYINPLPKDPINSGNPETAGTYGYSYEAPASATLSINAACPTGYAPYYILRTRLENASDKDTCKYKLYQRCGDTGTSSTWGCGPGNTPGSNAGLFIITSQ